MPSNQKKEDWPMIKLISLCERFGWHESLHKVMLQGHRAILFDELLTKSEAAHEAKILKELGCSVKVMPQHPQDVGGEKDRYAVYYWHPYH